MKKVISMFMAITLILSFCSIFASAEKVGNEDFVVSENILLSMEGSEASELVKSQIEETGVIVNESTKIELIAPSRTEARTAENSNGIDSALFVTNVVGNTVTTDVIIPGYEDGLGFQIEDVPMTRAGYSIDCDWYADFTVRGTAVFNYLPEGSMLSCYQPIGAYFTYQKNNSEADIRRIEVTYTCEGAEYTYPGYESLDSTVAWAIPVSEFRPSPNVMYSLNSPYYTDRVIFTGAGGGYSRQYLSFDVYDSGTRYFQSFPFYYR